ncbi:hypothetical protein CEXT_722481, partial [Caerostris extrusa]
VEKRREQQYPPKMRPKQNENKRQTTSQKINNLKTQYLQEQHVNKSATSSIDTSVDNVKISENLTDRFYSDETSEFSKEISSELYENINHLESIQDINFNNTSFLWNSNFEDIISESLPESSTAFTAANQSELTNHVLTHPNQINPSCVATSPIDTSVDNVKISENLTDRFYSDETSEFSKEISSELYQNINHLESIQDINFNNTSFLWNSNFEDLISESLPESSTAFTAANQSELTNHVLTHPNQINPSCVATSPIDTSVDNVKISENLTDRFYSDETSEFSKEISSELYQNINHLESIQDINFNNTSFLWNSNFEDLISESLPESSTAFTAANQSELTNHVLTHPNQINPSCVSKEYDSFTSDSLNTIEEWNQSDWNELNQFLERELLNSYSYNK